MREAAFALSRPSGGSVFTAVPINDGGAAVIAVSAVRTVPHNAAGQAQRDRALEESQRLGTAAALAYVEEVRRTAEVRKNPKAFE